ncbi:MAG: class I SAM-dependent methyltransferase [Nanoarchaeota archaeon]|nr:class I SAM-dependent methyltransferase [Nanoarchaeota archaeon]
MEVENQQKLWNKIAPEWHKYKNKPSENATQFLKKTRGNVLDLGSGSGRHLTKIKNGKMFLLDFSEKMIKLAEKKAKKEKIEAEFIVSGMDNIPKPDEFFDYSICVSALHCIETEEKRKKSVGELYRTLKKNREAYIGVWNKDSKRFKKSGKEKLVGWGKIGKRFYYLFEEKEIHELFKSAGFKITSTHNSEMMINFIIKKV